MKFHCHNFFYTSKINPDELKELRVGFFWLFSTLLFFVFILC
jgi:hypothetical protein